MSVPQSSRDRAEALRATLHAHNHRYYVLDDPQVSDAEYDALFRELQQLESDFPELLTADSPTQRVGGAPLKMFAAVHHRLPMRSEEHTSELQSLMRISYAVFCLKKKKQK